MEVVTITPPQLKVAERLRSFTPSRGLRRAFPWLLLLAAGSGCAALIYEVVWFQLLQLVIGSSAVSLGFVLGSYMGGLCLGSILLPRLVSPSRHPIAVFGLIELGVGKLGLLVLWIIPMLGRLYWLGATGGFAGLVLRGVIACVCLLPPTVLMGASLPAIARWMESTPRGVSSLGFLYGCNIGGAVAGTLLAGFYLLRVFDMRVATYTAVTINLAVAAAAFVISLNTRKGEQPYTTVYNNRLQKRDLLVLVTISLSGLSALGAEVVWTRLLSLLLGGTVYTFSIVLAVFLLGLWFGSTTGSFFVRHLADPRLALSGLQALLAVSIAWTAYALAYSLPGWPVDPWLSLSPWSNFELDFVRCLWAVFPAAILWGAAFPVALSALVTPGQDPGRLAARVYAANTIGSIIGALIFSLVLIPVAGTRISQQILIGISLAASLIAFCPVRRHRIPGLKLYTAASVVAVLLGYGLTWSIGEVPWELVAYGRRIAPTVRAFDLYPQQAPKVLYRGEGVNSSVVIVDRGGERTFYVSGKVEASTAFLDMRLERMMGHIPALLNSHPRTVLTVGFGAGVTAGSFIPYPELERLVICEIEPFIPKASNEFFGKENNQVFTNSRTHVVYDDARHYISTTGEKFDVITTDPIHPWVKGMSALYSYEYYEQVKKHLNRGGVVAQWLPIYDSDSDTVKSELATFFSVFPNGTIWSNFTQKDGYDLVLIGQSEPMPVDVDALQARLDNKGYSAVATSIEEVGFHSAVEILATYAGRQSDLRPYLAGAQINRDLNMRLQYLAGFGLNSMLYPKIFNEIESYRKFPEDIIVGAKGGRMDALRLLLGRGVVH